ncbi:hypothetical protein FACS1894189_8540 [Planctomycetales bacterium]|nr:hypothetical protein FACS1894189_8540 [Planctomycetales bacterium]
MRGHVYLLTNPSMPGWVKIGKTDRAVEDRIKELNKPTEVPLGFRYVADIETDDCELVESKIHSIIDTLNSRLRAQEFDDSGKVKRTREFFWLTPEAAIQVFKDVRALLGESAKLTLGEELSAAEQKEDAEISKEVRKVLLLDKESFFASVCNPAVIPAVQKFYDWASIKANIKFNNASFTVQWNPGKSTEFGLLPSGNPVKFSPLTIRPNGSLTVNYGDHHPDELNRGLYDALKNKGVETQPSNNVSRTNPTLSPEYVVEKVDAIIAAVDEFVAKYANK